MKLHNRSIMVTGGAGFIGSHLVDELIAEDPESIVVIDNFFLGKERNLIGARQRYPELKVLNQDASDYGAMKRIVQEGGIDTVFNLAVLPLPASLERPAWTFTQNNNMTLALCELAREGLFDTLVHFSSSEAYGNSVSDSMDENHPLNARTPYAASKAACDHLVMSYFRTFGIKASIVRPFNNYGPRQNEGNYAGVIPLTIKRILNGETPRIHGDGRQTRDYIYVTDTAKAALKVLESENTRGRVLNIASGREVSINYLVRLITDLMDWQGEIIREPERPGDVRRHIANIYLAEDLINFHQTVSLEEGMRRTVEWYRSNIIL